MPVDVAFRSFLHALLDDAVGLAQYLGRQVPAAQTGDVVVQAPNGVADERWIPVFMNASLSTQT